MQRFVVSRPTAYRIVNITATCSVAVFMKSGVRMTKTQKILSSVLTVALGVMLIILRSDIVSIAMTVLGVGCIILGVFDLVQKLVPPAVVKIVAGIIVIICGWVIVSAVLYVLAGALLIVGVLFLYEKIKGRVRCQTWYYTLCEYAVPILCIVIGTLLLFNQGNTMNWVFIVGGGITIVEGGLLLVDALQMEN